MRVSLLFFSKISCPNYNRHNRRGFFVRNFTDNFLTLHSEILTLERTCCPHCITLCAVPALQPLQCPCPSVTASAMSLSRCHSVCAIPPLRCFFRFDPTLLTIVDTLSLQSATLPLIQFSLAEIRPVRKSICLGK